jgi:uncharacterized membrane protein YGL010W
MKTINQWLAEYGESHQNEANKTIHWICVPAIFFSVIALLFCVKLGVYFGRYQLNLAEVIMALVVIYYASLSKTLWLGMMVFGMICLLLSNFVENLEIIPLWQFALGIFVLAWIAQLYGHKIEGKKPSFFKDIQFLLIGPAWLMSFIYKKLGISL